MVVSIDFFFSVVIPFVPVKLGDVDLINPTVERNARY